MRPAEDSRLHCSGATLMMARFDSPRIILTGAGSRAKIADVLTSLSARRTLVVVDPYFSSSGTVLADITASLAQAGIGSEVFTDFQPDPTDRNVTAGVERFRAFGSDSILAIGGGSAIDVAKIIGAASANAEPLKSFQGYERIPKSGPPLLAIPTTAGTGSEATKVAVITDTERNVKMMILDPKLMPAAAIVDWELTATMPRPLTAHVGVDTLTHGIEAYVSRKANSLTDTLAASCVAKVQTYLKRA